MIRERSPMEPTAGDSAEQLDRDSRRRLQNRVNQRASRKRKRAREQREHQGQRWVIYTNDSKASPGAEVVRAQVTPESSPMSASSPIGQGHSGSFLCDSSQLSPEQYFDRLRKLVVEAAGKSPPSLGLIPFVKQFNIIRAMLENATTMELTMDILDDDIASSFNIAGPVTFHLPPSLQPSSTQRQIIHHPWIDLIPVRSLRNTLIVRMTEYDEDELCGDLYGYGVKSAWGEVGLIIWGESWDPSAYELSETVLKKWGWILKDSPELLASTNYWRRKRGEKPLWPFEPREHVIHEIE